MPWSAWQFLFFTYHFGCLQFSSSEILKPTQYIEIFIRYIQNDLSFDISYPVLPWCYMTCTQYDLCPSSLNHACTWNADKITPLGFLIYQPTDIIYPPIFWTSRGLQVLAEWGVKPFRRWRPLPASVILLSLPRVCILWVPLTIFACFVGSAARLVH
jgi:hypothetical protein